MGDLPLIKISNQNDFHVQLRVIKGYMVKMGKKIAPSWKTLMVFNAICLQDEIHCINSSLTEVVDDLNFCSNETWSVTALVLIAGTSNELVTWTRGKNVTKQNRDLFPVRRVSSTFLWKPFPVTFLVFNSTTSTKFVVKENNLLPLFI